ncbi:MAG: DUF4372 domain-containing protein [Acidobacteria bacterium]|nr:DUF4372 domain-containing protein [Acidobacteriota bacterium]
MNRVSSIFSQMLKEVQAPLFQLAVDSHRGERHARGFRCWDQFVAMLFCQLGQAKSLREIEEGLLAIRRWRTPTSTVLGRSTRRSFTLYSAAWWPSSVRHRRRLASACPASC